MEYPSKPVGKCYVCGKRILWADNDWRFADKGRDPTRIIHDACQSKTKEPTP